MSKEFYKSKTFWFFGLTLLVAVAGLFGFAEFQPTPEQSEAVLAIVSLAGLVLRFLTKTAVKL